VINRRAWLVGAVGLLAAPRSGEAQPAKVYQLGLLNPSSLIGPGPLAGPNLLIESLVELGYVEGRNLKVERRYAEGHLERLPALAAELVQRRVDVVVVFGSAALEAAQEATRTIPIVILTAGADPVELGLIASLARPGGNVTGVAQGAILAGKRLELLREAVPRATRLAMLVPPEAPETLSARMQVQEAEDAARRLGVTLISVPARSRDYEQAFQTMVAERAGALFVTASPIFSADRARIIALAARHRLPAIYQWPEHVREGGLMAYGPSLRTLNRRVAAFVDRIFKGAAPATLPVEQATELVLALNLKTAKALGLTIPSSVLARADEVIRE
jgi:putative tryptophan/tyrosine transport system substrate-binding protein